MKKKIKLLEKLFKEAKNGDEKAEKLFIASVEKDKKEIMLNENVGKEIKEYFLNNYQKHFLYIIKRSYLEILAEYLLDKRRNNERNKN